MRMLLRRRDAAALGVLHGRMIRALLGVGELCGNVASHVFTLIGCSPTNAQRVVDGVINAKIAGVVLDTMCFRMLSVMSLNMSAALDLQQPTATLKTC